MGRSPLTYIFICSDFDDNFFAYISDDLKPKKNLPCFFCRNKRFDNNFFVDKIFCFGLKSSETHAKKVWPLLRGGGGGLYIVK